MAFFDLRGNAENGEEVANGVLTCGQTCDWGKRIEELCRYNPGFNLREFYRVFGRNEDLVLCYGPLDEQTQDGMDYKELLIQ
ncbi:unnamed protein product, partial [Amoebophrya sp. A25]|eukprot:GSA25T00024930001.1